jgi:hypothetical protein
VLGWRCKPNDLFFSSHFSLSLTRKSCRACKIVKLCFDLILKCKIWFLVFQFLFFVLDLFVRFWYLFNFIIQSQFVICYIFQFSPLSFDFFCLGPFVKLIFIFNFTL